MRSSFAWRALLVVAVACVGLGTAGTATAAKYLVLYKAEAVPANVHNWVERSGGQVVVAHPQIGVVIAQSNSPTFGQAMRGDARIAEVAEITQPIAKVDPLEPQGHDGQPSELPNAPATDADTFSPLQWDMRQIHTPEAHAVTGGSPAVVVGDIDTGLDKDHPDLLANIDFSRSVSCESGAPNQNPAAWDDHNGHGTHTAGTVAAASNGIGIVGVAPNVKLAGIKSSLDSGFFFPEMVICSFMWAGGAGFDLPAGQPDVPATVGPRVDVTNNSYFADPWLYNCRNDAGQRAIWKAEKRAIDFATKQGVTNVAAIGNDFDDRAHPSIDFISPDFPPGSEVEREVTNACVVIPVEVNGVIGVTGVGNARQTDNDDDPNDYLKSFYSSYGVGVAEVTAPAGDSIFGRTAEAPNGRVLSTYPAEAFCSSIVGRRLVDPGPPTSVYCYLQGTSMASPHAAGVAALIISRYGDLDNPQNGKMRPGSVAAYLEQTADSQPCPTALPPGYLETFTLPNNEPQRCQGGPGYTSWYGNGQVNAFRAVTHHSD